MGTENAEFCSGYLIKRLIHQEFPQIPQISQVKKLRNLCDPWDFKLKKTMTATEFIEKLSSFFVHFY